MKINSKEFKDQIDNFQIEKGISKRQARKKIFWQIVESRKKQNDLQKKGIGKEVKVAQENVKSQKELKKFCWWGSLFKANGISFFGKR